ncbi:hypothetical protein [Neisseria flavescens]|uniref:hypothetical protein n=1 Tax=Neisseria flavescens TaxID=484 RepID=UPI001E3E3E4D|nr:hypothetical protein [Neisseria flavescens]
MTALKHLKPLFWIAVMALICVRPIALIFAYSPFHDVNDFFALACVITLRVPKNVPTESRPPIYCGGLYLNRGFSHSYL